MTTNEENVDEIATVELELAAAQEETERLSAENRHLKTRVVLLRALVNRYQPKEDDSSSKKVAQPQDRKPPSKRAQSRSTSKRTQSRSRGK